MDKGNLELSFKALSDSTRLKILEILKRPGKSSCGLIGKNERGLCACDIQEAIGLSQAATSHHLELLKRAGLIHAEKRERWMFYWRNDTAIASLAQQLAKSV
jgi:ArsR family transcriptional regulator, arsenate/arsenite/antimonite-responsive transcriptional repressor